VRVEYGDATTTIDPVGVDAVAQAFPRTYGQRLVTFLAPDAGAAADAVVEDRPPIRSVKLTQQGPLTDGNLQRQHYYRIQIQCSDF
jgi:hypothetical protein